MDRLNITPKFVKSADAEFNHSRELLTTKPGLVIANHPSGDIDSISVLSQIKRRDLKIVAHRKRMGEFASFCPDLFLPAVKSPHGLLQVLRAVNEHIERGGLALIFPTRGQKRKDKANRGFQSGFRSIVQRLRPDDMIYSFYINPSDASEALSQMPEGTLQRLDQPQEIKIEEAYSESAEWQAIINSSTKDAVNEKLTKHFLKKFYRERFD